MARREGLELTQRGWRPALVLGVGAGLFGVPWAPLPVAQTNRLSAAVHWVAPVVTGAIAILLLALTAWLEIPVTRARGRRVRIRDAMEPRPSERGPIPPTASLRRRTLRCVRGASTVILCSPRVKSHKVV